MLPTPLTIILSGIFGQGFFFAVFLSIMSVAIIAGVVLLIIKGVGKLLRR